MASEKLRNALGEIKEVPEGQWPFIFYGRNPRYLGNVKDYGDADLLLVANQLSATYLSKTEVDGRKFIIAHG